eukprot:766331-Hanusia_phi.AAC.4
MNRVRGSDRAAASACCHRAHGWPAVLAADEPRQDSLRGTLSWEGLSALGERGESESGYLAEGVLVLLSLEDEGVFENLVEAQALVRLLDQQLGDKILGILRQLLPRHLAHALLLSPAHRGRILEVDLGDALVRLAVALRLEGRRADQQLVAQDPQRPDVHCLVVRLPLHHLRRQVV